MITLFPYQSALPER